MPRVVVLTQHRRGSASLCLPELAREKGVEVVGIIYTPNPPANPWKKLRRDLKKVSRIGLLGAFNGVRMRTWYRIPGTEDLFVLAGRLGIRIETSPRLNHAVTRDLLRDMAPDLALSLGCGYITKKVFSLPRHGTLNIHGEILPDFRGAASVVWSIHEGKVETGFTIHHVNTLIDGGPIVYQERFPIRFEGSLEATVVATVAEINRRVPTALARTVRDYEPTSLSIQPQGDGRSFTTPSIWQYLHMVRMHRRLLRDQRSPCDGVG
jgi:methionyl-tRNA formyltransferase